MEKYRLNKQLLEAAKKEDLVNMKRCVELGADVNTVDLEMTLIHSWHVLHFVAGKGNLQCVQFLIENGANVDAREGDRWTPLHLAAKSGYFRCVEYLVRQGADVHAKTNIGDTPIDMAMRNGFIEMAEFMLHFKTAKKEYENLDSLIKTNEYLESIQF